MGGTVHNAAPFAGQRSPAGIRFESDALRDRAGIRKESAMSVYKRGRIWWVCLTDATGRLIRRSAHTHLRAEAEILERRLRESLGKGHQVFDISAPKQITFEQLLDECLASWQTSARSFESYFLANTKVLREAFGRLFINEIRPVDVQRFRDTRARSVSPATVNRGTALLKRVFNLAISWGYLEKNPVRCGMLQEPPGRVRYLTPDEQRRLLDHLPDDLKPLVTVALHTGMRKSELTNLRLGPNVDFQKNLITLRKTKNGRMRHIPMSNTARETLLGLARGKLEGDLFFATRNNTPLKHFKLRWKKALVAAGIKDFRFHDLRHTFASNLVAGGVALVSVKELLGHSSFQMTLRYSHLAPEFQRDAISRMEKYCETGLHSGDEGIENKGGKLHRGG